LLLENQLDTIEKLEISLALREAPHGLALDELAHRLQVGPEVLGRVVSELVRSGLVDVHPAGTRFALRAEAVGREVLAEAAQLYADDRPGVIALMSRLARRRLRTLAARRFGPSDLAKKGGDEGE
jgi:DNA-binding IclR family transcriptional regulator